MSLWSSEVVLFLKTEDAFCLHSKSKQAYLGSFGNQDDNDEENWESRKGEETTPLLELSQIKCLDFFSDILKDGLMEENIFPSMLARRQDSKHIKACSSQVIESSILVSPVQDRKPIWRKDTMGQDCRLCLPCKGKLKDAWNPDRGTSRIDAWAC